MRIGSIKITDDYPRHMEAIESARYAHSDGMGAFMCFMAVRILEMHRILRNDGSIYLHCATACHYLKAVLDAIFGASQFRNDIIWRRTGSHNFADRFGPIHDNILFYAKPDYKHRVLIHAVPSRLRGRVLQEVGRARPLSGAEDARVRDAERREQAAVTRI